MYTKISCRATLPIQGPMKRGGGALTTSTVQKHGKDVIQITLKSIIYLVVDGVVMIFELWEGNAFEATELF
jgi:hypothetical protein